MGDRLSNNNRVLDQRSQGRTAATGSNNVSDNVVILQADPRPRPPAGRHAIAPTAEAKGLTAFLQEFPSLDKLSRQFPELTNLTPPAKIDDDNLASFESLLKSILEPTRYGELTRRHAPVDILNGLMELSARQKGGETPVIRRRGKSEIAEKSQEDRRADSRPRPRGGHLLHFLLNREIGARPRPGDDLPPRFVALGRNEFARLAATLNCDVEMLRKEYEGRMTTSLTTAGEKHPAHPAFLREYTESLAREVEEVGLILLNSFEAPLEIENEVSVFFRHLFRFECIVRFFDNVLGDCPSHEKDSDEVFLARLEKPVANVLSKTSDEILLSLLIFERARPDFRKRNAFERALVESLIAVYETGDMEKAKSLFRSGLSDMSLRIASSKNYSDIIKIKKATEYASSVLVVFIGMRDEVKYADERKLQITKELIKATAFYYCLCCKKQPEAAEDMAVALGNLFGWAEPEASH